MVRCGQEGRPAGNRYAAIPRRFRICRNAGSCYVRGRSFLFAFPWCLVPVLMSAPACVRGVVRLAERFPGGCLCMVAAPAICRYVWIMRPGVADVSPIINHPRPKHHPAAPVCSCCADVPAPLPRRKTKRGVAEKRRPFVGEGVDICHTLIFDSPIIVPCCLLSLPLHGF